MVGGQATIVSKFCLLCSGESSSQSHRCNIWAGKFCNLRFIWTARVTEGTLLGQAAKFVLCSIVSIRVRSGIEAVLGSNPCADFLLPKLQILVNAVTEQPEKR